MIHLDTNFLIRGVVQGTRENERLRAWIRQGESIGISAVAWAEFRCGPVTPGETSGAASLVGAPEPFSADQAETAARLFNVGGRQRGSMLDCLIAATALSCDAHLATSDGADFQRFEAHGLRLATMSA